MNKSKLKNFFSVGVSFLILWSLETALSAVIHNSENLIIPVGESYTLDGTHNFSNSIEVYGTLYVTPYNPDSADLLTLSSEKTFLSANVSPINIFSKNP